MAGSNPDRTASAESLDSIIPGAFPDSDGTSASPQQTLSQALFSRRAEYTSPRSVRIKVGTWNVAALNDTASDIAGWFLEEKAIAHGVRKLDPEEGSAKPHDAGAPPEEEEIGIYALGLQEIVNVASPTEALRPYTDPGPSNRIKTAIETALPTGYQLVAEQQLIGLLLLIYTSPTIAPHVQSVSSTSVGTGFMGYLGNKGAVCSRLVLGETTRLVFINCHLAAGADKASLERRNWDASQVVTRTKFEPIADALGGQAPTGEGLGEEDFAFWFGDLNYRLEGMPGDDVRRLLTIHTKDLDPEPAQTADESPMETPATDNNSTTSESSHDSASVDKDDDSINLPAEEDPASLMTTISSLLPHDELRQQQKAGKAFHDGWKEGPIDFLPTYKYDVGKVGVFDSSEKRRCPSWCDRILYRSKASKEAHNRKMQELEDAKKKDEEMKARGLDEADNDEDVLFDYDPETDGGDDDYDELADASSESHQSQDDSGHGILLERYRPHQRVLSSDHKPLEAVFSLKFDAILPDLKAKVHQDIVKELDRTENEGRPSVAVVVDRPSGDHKPKTESRKEAESDGVNFGEIRYYTPERRTITVANTGRVPAAFGFAYRPMAALGEPDGSLPPWLSADFDREPSESQSDGDGKQYTLEPAEVLNIELTARVVDLNLVRKLNQGVMRLDDILVLRIRDGRDHFLPVRGYWLHSAFGRSIDELIRIPEGGIRKLQRQDASSDQEVKWSAPRELFRLTETIEDLIERVVAEWGMKDHDGLQAPWQENAGWPFVERTGDSTSSQLHDNLFSGICEALDTDTRFDTVFTPDITSFDRLEVLAEVLLTFLRSLQDGVVTKEMWERFERDMAVQERSKQQKPTEEGRLWALEILSSTPNHNVSFILLTSMLSRLANELTNAAKQEENPRQNADLPRSPGVAVRRKTLSKIPEVARRQIICRNYSMMFAEAMFRAQPEDLKEKERRARDERMVKILELFLHEATEARTW